jgi:hypothetical protein
VVNLWFQHAANTMLEGWYYAPEGALLDILLYNIAVRWLVHRARTAEASRG